MEVNFEENDFCVACRFLVGHTARILFDIFTTVDLYIFFCKKCIRGMGTHPVPKPKTIFGYQKINNVTVIR